ncbi:MAG TPA: ABC transporter ATP-binding protein/permease [Hyphomicrobiaceae bacterium]|nr:ABC transporter ATP-binding protein/permease [Hyphomicrobiaceae bacterium]
MDAYNLDPRIARAFARFTGGFWKGETATRAWTLTLGLAAALLLSLGATVALNRWQRWFFDALERKDSETAAWAVLVFAAIIASMAAVGVAIVITRETLQVRWREWIVKRLVAQWLGRNRFYHLGATHTEPEVPEYRIADDTRWATEPLVDLAIGLFSAFFGAAAFISILWYVGGSITVSLVGVPITIPAYMVLAALAYGGIASGLMLWVGRALVGCVARKNASEAEFRFGLMRVRENAESVSLIGGGPSEVRDLSFRYDTVVARWLAIVRQHGRLTWITNASGPMIPIVPLLFAAPKYFAGELTLGEVVQLAAAFVQVQLAISWVVDNYNRIAEWFASARRVMDVVTACEALDARFARLQQARIAVTPASDGRVRLAGLTVLDSEGRPLVAGTDLLIEPGERVLISGNSSTGKTMLVRAISGIWPWGAGRIEIPCDARLMVVPQKPYIPLGTLRHALVYPYGRIDADDGRIRQALNDIGIGHLAPRLDEEDRWDQVLGAGERQRLSIARALLHRPSVLVLDDAMAALEEEAQNRLYRTIESWLPSAIVLSLGQRSRADGFHERRLLLEPAQHGSRLRPLEAAIA